MRRSAAGRGRGGRLKLRQVPVNSAAAAAAPSSAAACAAPAAPAASSVAEPAASSVRGDRSAGPSKPRAATKRQPRAGGKVAQQSFMASWLAQPKPKDQGGDDEDDEAPPAAAAAAWHSDASDDDDADIYGAAAAAQSARAEQPQPQPPQPQPQPQPQRPVEDLTADAADDAGVVDLTDADEPPPPAASRPASRKADRDEAASLAMALRLHREEQEAAARPQPQRKRPAADGSRAAGQTLPRGASVPTGGSQQRAAGELEAKLKQHFGHSAFRCDEQRAAVACVLEEKRDCVLLMPTGMGKSLCFQLPALILNERSGALTVVVSPLLALMSEQVKTLCSKGKSACMINSLLTSHERRDVFKRLGAMAAPLGHNFTAQNGVQLLYVTPESLTSNDDVVRVLQKIQRRGRLGLFAVDEAHCISSWGHDFRPAYRRLGDIRNAFKGVPCIALTATATKSIVTDLSSNLKLEHPRVICMSFDRPNICACSTHCHTHRHPFGM